MGDLVPKMCIIMNVAEAERFRELFEQEWPQHALVVSPYVPKGKVYLMPKDPPVVPYLDFGTLDG